MTEWKTYKLGDLVRRKIGYGIVQPGKSLRFGCPIIKVNNINAGLHSVDVLDKTSLEIERKYQRTRLKGGELIISLVGSVGNTAIVPFAFKGCNLVRATGLIDIEDVTLTKWVKYYIDSPEGKKYIQQNLNTTVQPTLNVKSLVEMPIPIPNKATIDKIVAILSSLDDKIDLNRRINANLEAQAQSLFDKMVVDGCAGAQKLSLLDIANYTNGLAMQKFRPEANEEGMPVLKIKELGHGKCDSSSDVCSAAIGEEFIVNDGDIIFSWSGTLLVDIWCGGKCGLNQHLFKVTSDSYPKWFVYFWTKHHLANFIRIATDKAVTMGHIKRCDLAASEVYIPNEENLARIDARIAPIIDQIINNRIENKHLSTLRDTLLPKLIMEDYEDS